MSYRAIIVFLLSIFFQNQVWATYDSLTFLEKLQLKIDSIANMAISKGALPGCSVYASYAGKPIFYKTYGFHTYDSIVPVGTADLYDLASVTKVMASTVALMKLYDNGQLDLDRPIADYINGIANSDFGKVTLRKALAHQGGLKNWIKFYDEIKRKNGRYKSKTIASEYSEKYPFKVAEDKYLHLDFYKQIKKMIRKSEVDKEPSYVYSGLFFYLVPELVQNITDTAFADYLKRHFYDPMQMDRVTFNPLEGYRLGEVVPTEIDSFFRFHPIHGLVHDEGAILMRGVSGNAGLFGPAHQVAALWHMFLNGGTYQGKRYLHPGTIDLFTTYQYPNRGNRRGLGFDKPLLEYDAAKSSVAKSASPESYGHTGYTGTLVWADPKFDILFVFLSNRVYPSRDNRLIYELNIRPAIHQAIYDYLMEGLGYLEYPDICR